ncbi:MAG: amidohydrolase family protein [Rhizobiaceae bacterium]|nr:amidohydrolase family protein [Rhizobiaceae bacterium]
MSDAAVSQTLITNGTVWTEGAFRRADILVDGISISAITAPGAAGEAPLARIDATGCAILPPFFNGHVHSSSTLFRGTENSYPLELWSLWAICYGRGSTAASITVALRLNAIEMIRAGIGGYIDHFPPAHFMDEALQVHRCSGLRVGFAPFFADLRDEDILDMPLDRTILEAHAQGPISNHDALRLRTERLAAMRDARITPLLGPNAPQRCSQPLLELWAELGARHDLGSHSHLLETYPQHRLAQARWPRGAVSELDRLGLLDGRTSLAHAIWLDDTARETLARRGATAIHNPLSNQMLGSGAMPVRTMLDAGVRLGLGTDCSNTAGRHDMFETMRQMLVSGRNPGTWHGGWIRADEALAAASQNGWSALGQGPARLAAGAPADLLILDFRSVTLAASAISPASIVSHGDPRAVRDLMVDGRWLLRDRQVTVFDEAAVIAEAERHAVDLRASSESGRASLKQLIGSYDDWTNKAFAGSAYLHCGRLHLSTRARVEGGDTT